jgi:hypothetical protein
MKTITFTSLKKFDNYMQTGSSSFLGDINPSQLKRGQEFVIAGEGWDWTVKVHP